MAIKENMTLSATINILVATVDTVAINLYANIDSKNISVTYGKVAGVEITVAGDITRAKAEYEAFINTVEDRAIDFGHVCFTAMV